MRGRLRQQHQARGLERRGREDDRAPLHRVRLSGDGVDEADAFRLAGCRVDLHLVRRRIGAYGELAGVTGRINESSRRVERRVDVAAADVTAARAASVTLASVL